MKKLVVLVILLFSVNTFAADRYCGSSSAGSNNGTDWANQWACPGSPSSGDTVYMDGGSSGVTYTIDTTEWTLSTNATYKCGSASPTPIDHSGLVRIQPHSAGDPNSAVTIHADVVINGAYDGRTTAGGTINMVFGYNWTVILQEEGHKVSAYYIEIEQCEDGILMKTSNATAAAPSVIAYNNIHNCNEGCIVSSSDTAYDSDSILIHHNTLGTNCWLFEGALGCLQSMIDNPGDDSKSCGAGGDGVRGGSGLSIYNNTITCNWGNLGDSTQHQDGIQLLGGNNKIYNNLIDTSAQGIFVDPYGSKSNVYIYNNVVQSAGPASRTGDINSGIVLMQDGTKGESPYNVTFDNFQVFNNVIADWPYAGIWLQSFGATTPHWTNSVFKNNIIINSGHDLGGGISADGTGTYTCGTTGDGADLTFDKNVLYVDSEHTDYGKNNIWCNGANVSQASGSTSLPAFTSYTYRPAYNSATRNDYTLTSGDTVAKWTGTATGQLSSTDKAGINWHSPPSIGAYEYVAGAVTDTISGAVLSGAVVK